MLLRVAIRIGIFSSLALTLSAEPVRAQALPRPAADTAEISAAVRRYIDALSTRDTAYIRAASLPQATSISVAFPAVPGQVASVRTVDEVIAGLARETRRFQGRVWSPRISIEGSIAVFIAPYDVWHDGRFSNCGIDHYVFVRSGDRWLVSQLLYTKQLVGCDPSPLSPPN